MPVPTTSPVPITQHGAITDPDLVALVLDLYRRAQADVDAEHVTRESLSDQEFRRHLASPGTLTWLAWHGDAPIGLATVSSDPAASGWLNPSYLARRFPHHVAQSSLYYAMALDVAPEFRSTTVFARLMTRALTELHRRGAIMLFDVNQSQPGRSVDLADIVVRLAHRVDRTSRSEPIGTVRYYAVDFAAADHVVDVRDEERPVIELPVEHHDDVAGERVRRPA